MGICGCDWLVFLLRRRFHECAVFVDEAFAHSVHGDSDDSTLC